MRYERERERRERNAASHSQRHDFWVYLCCKGQLWIYNDILAYQLEGIDCVCQVEIDRVPIALVLNLRTAKKKLNGFITAEPLIVFCWIQSNTRPWTDTNWYEEICGEKKMSRLKGKMVYRNECGVSTHPSVWRNVRTAHCAPRQT